jgi:uncharacterized protein (TIGR00255 family)
MLKSMTAFGRAESEAEGRKYTCEMRSLNNRYLDVLVRLPRRYAVLEERVKKLVAARVTRGRVEVAVQVNGEKGEGAPVQVEVNLGLARNFHEQLERLRRELGLAEPVGLELLLSLGRDIFEVKEEEESAEAVWERLSRPVEAALTALEAMRAEEGRILSADFTERLGAVEGLLSRVSERTPALVEEYRAKLTERIRSALGELAVDEARLLQEVAIFADRADVAEELVRARSHLEQFRALLEMDEPVGRKLNFLLQELGREVNTIGSKAPDAAVSQLVVEAKSELERMREQVQNIE